MLVGNATRRDTAAAIQGLNAISRLLDQHLRAYKQPTVHAPHQTAHAAYTSYHDSMPNHQQVTSTGLAATQTWTAGSENYSGPEHNSRIEQAENTTHKQQTNDMTGQSHGKLRGPNQDGYDEFEAATAAVDMAAHGTLSGADDSHALPEAVIGDGGSTTVSQEVQQALSEQARAKFILAALSASAMIFKNVSHNLTAEISWLQDAAALDNVEAQLALADRYLMGRGVDVSCSTGLYYLKKAAARIATNVQKVLVIQLYSYRVLNSA